MLAKLHLTATARDALIPVGCWRPLQRHLAEPLMILAEPLMILAEPLMILDPEAPRMHCPCAEHLMIQGPPACLTRRPAVVY